VADQLEIRFGTSGFRGRWGIEFTEPHVKVVTQAICDHLLELHLDGKAVVLGYDSRLYADEVAGWCAEVLIANGFPVHFTSRDTPTPALIYYGIEEVGEAHIAGIINCTASHNPIEWHGIKFSPRNGCPAPPSVTSRIEELANSYLATSIEIESAELTTAERNNQLLWFDPIDSYCQWILTSGQADNRIPLNHAQMREYFMDKLVVIDEMHGTGRDYFRVILDQIGVRYEVLHGERDPELGDLHAANPEEPYINALCERVRDSGAVLGIGLDTDADRYGIVDVNGRYITPNQILASLTHFLGVDRRINGRVAVSHVSTRLCETIAGRIKGNESLRPFTSISPHYMTTPDYDVLVGELGDLSSENVFTVPVGLKYIVEVPQMDRSYRLLQSPPENWRDVLLIGGEESSGLTTKGHLPDKDGIWAGLLVMDMMAHYQKSLVEIWSDVTKLYWNSHTKRLNLDVPDGVKSKFINHFFEKFSESENRRFADLNLIFAGGIRGKLIEMRLEDEHGGTHYYVHSRPSGTEPLIRVYIETQQESALEKIEEELELVLQSLLTA